MSSLADHVAELKEHWGQRHTSLYAALCQTMVEAHLPELERLVAVNADALQNLALNAERSEELAQAKADAERLAEALEFYATDRFYRYQPECGCSSIDADGGETAQEALATYREKHNG